MGRLIGKVNKGHYRVFTNVAKDIIFSERFQSLKKYIQHGDPSTFKHLLGVAYTAFVISEKLRLKTDIKDLIAGALLHDYVFYDWHTSCVADKLCSIKEMFQKIKPRKYTELK